MRVVAPVDVMIVMRRSDWGQLRRQPLCLRPLPRGSLNGAKLAGSLRRGAVVCAAASCLVLTHGKRGLALITSPDIALGMTTARAKELLMRHRRLGIHKSTAPWHLAIPLVALCQLGCAGRGWDPDDPRARQADDFSETIARFKDKTPRSRKYFQQAYGYAIFPTVGKGGFVAGGSYGRGRVFEGGKPIGTASVTQVTIGAQLGAQSFSQVIFFKDKRALEQFKRGKFVAAAQASAIAVTAGAAAQASYSDGVAILALTKGGLMYEAAVGGQRFSFQAAKGK